MTNKKDEKKRRRDIKPEFMISNVPQLPEKKISAAQQIQLDIIAKTNFNFFNTTLSVEHGQRLFEHEPFKDRAFTKPFDDLAMDGWERASPSIGARGKKLRGVCRGIGFADVGATPAKPGKSKRA